MSMLSTAVWVGENESGSGMMVENGLRSPDDGRLADDEPLDDGERVVPEQPAMFTHVRHMIRSRLSIAEQQQIQRRAIDHIGADAVGIAESSGRLAVRSCRFRLHGLPFPPVSNASDRGPLARRRLS